MPDRSTSDGDIPVLTDVVKEADVREFPSHADALIAELQTALAASAFALTERLLQGALAEMEAAVFEQVTAKLRQELPELIDNVLRQHLGADEET
jgi:hypothetical protein